LKLKFILNGWVLMAASLCVFLKLSGVTASANQTHWSPARFVEINTANQPLVSMNYRELRCVATAVYYESAHEPRMGQIAVARVIQNRVRQRFAATACDVVYQRRSGVCQFSWACNSHRVITAKECSECWKIAVQVFAQNQYQSFMPSALFFHATYIDPQWASVRAIKTIGHHKFYRKN
jgi:spore germination cell wall hydrolase CwlJ-like protein